MEWISQVEDREIATRVVELVPLETWAGLTDSERAAWLNLCDGLHRARVSDAEQRTATLSDPMHADLTALAALEPHVASTALGYCSMGQPIADASRSATTAWGNRSPRAPASEVP